MIAARIILALVIALVLVACGADATSSPEATDVPTANPTDDVDTLTPTRTSASSTPVAAAVADARLWKYVNSGWVSLRGGENLSVFTSELRAFVITSQEELDAYQDGINIKRSYGTTTSLGRVDFADSILLAAYYVWRPLQGDPLSIVEFSLNDGQAEVLLELEDSPQGKAYPYLLAPMTMVAVDRSHFPSGAPVNFVFRVNGGPQATVVASVK